jgi:hypothetical protein
MPRRVDIKALKLDRSEFPNRVPWSYVTTAELARALKLPLQSVHNYIGRGLLAKPEQRPEFEGLGNKRFFKISAVESAITGKAPEEIELEWMQNRFPTMGFQRVGQAYHAAKICWKALGLERPLI